MTQKVKVQGHTRTKLELILSEYIILDCLGRVVFLVSLINVSVEFRVVDCTVLYCSIVLFQSSVELCRRLKPIIKRQLLVQLVTV